MLPHLWLAQAPPIVLQLSSIRYSYTYRVEYAEVVRPDGTVLLCPVCSCHLSFFLFLFPFLSLPPSLLPFPFFLLSFYSHFLMHSHALSLCCAHDFFQCSLAFYSCRSSSIVKRLFLSTSSIREWESERLLAASLPSSLACVSAVRWWMGERQWRWRYLQPGQVYTCTYMYVLHVQDITKLATVLIILNFNIHLYAWLYRTIVQQLYTPAKWVLKHIKYTCI